MSLNKKTIEIGKIRKKRVSIWSRVFTQNIKRQANFVVFISMFSFLLFAIFLSLALTLKVDITVPAEGKLLKLTTGDFIIEATLSQAYASSIHIKQKAILKFQTINKKIKTYGEVVEIAAELKESHLPIKIKPLLDIQTLEKTYPKINKLTIRVIIERKSLIDLLITKK